MSATSARRTPALRRRDEAKALFRNAILEAAEQVFAERGFHGARIQDIAEQARIAVGTVYNHFEQKEDVLRALLEERSEELFAEFAPLPTDPADFEGKLAARFTRMLRHIQRHHSFLVVAAENGLFAKTAAGALGGKRVKHIERFRASLRELVEEGLASGELEPHDPTHLTLFLGGMLRGFTIGAVEGRVTDPEADAKLIAHMFLNGAGRAPRSRRSEDRPSSVRARRT